MKLHHQENHKTSDFKDIIFIPSRNLASFSRTNTEITLARGYKRTTIMKSEKIEPRAPQKPFVEYAGLGNGLDCFMEYSNTSLLLQPEASTQVFVAMNELISLVNGTYPSSTQDW